MKLNFPPYFFELDLKDYIDYVNSEVKVVKGMVVFLLKKQTRGLWKSVAYASTGESLRERRSASMNRQLQREEELKEQKLRDNAEKQSFLIRQQMQVEKEAKQKIEQKKALHAEQARDEILNWSIKLQTENPADPNKDVADGSVDEELELLERQLRQQLALKRSKECAPIRASNTVDLRLAFTKSALPTAAREAKDKNYEAWLQAQRGNVSQPSKV